MSNNNYFSSSILTAVITKTSIAPLTRIKVLQQIQTFHNTNNYSNFFGSIKYIFRNEGIIGFYKGNFANVAKSIPNYSLKFPLNEMFINYILKDKNLKSKKDLSFTQLLQAGVFTGLNQTLITYPIDLIRTRITQDKKMIENKVGIIKCTQNTIKNEGFFSLYKGLIPAVATAPIYIGLQLSIYQYLRNQENIYFSNSIMSGALAGLISQTAMYPGDTVKRQMQINGMNNLKYISLSDCIKYIYRTYGIRGFYLGIFINSIKSIPEIAIKFTIYEFLKENLKF